MEALIEQSFAHVENSELITRVKRGHFDLVDSSGALVLPSLWETIVQPDWAVTMRMWPLPENSERPTHSSLPPEPRPLLSKPVPPAAPNPLSTVTEPSSRTVRPDGVIVEVRDRFSNGETDSVAESMSTDGGGDHRNHKSTYRDTLTEDSTRNGQQFEETRAAVMARSWAKVQKSEAELWQLDPSLPKKQSAQGHHQNVAETSVGLVQGGSTMGTASGRETQTSEELPCSSDTQSTGQRWQLAPAMGHVGSRNLCRNCQSPLSSTKSQQQTAALYQTSSHQQLSEAIDHISPHNLPPRGALEKRIETLEDIIKRQDADHQARVERPKSIENEQRLSRLGNAIMQNSAQTPLLTPTLLVPSKDLLTEFIPPQSTPSMSGSVPARDSSRCLFRRRLFGRSSLSSSAASL